MKLRIIFCEPPAQKIAPVNDEILLVISSPYKVVQAEIGDTRTYEDPDGNVIALTYEHYCQEMRALISDRLDQSEIAHHVYEQITITGFNQAPNFEVMCSKLENMPILCTSTTNITFEQCAFGGLGYIRPTIKLIRALQRRHEEHRSEKLNVRIHVVEAGPVFLSHHDEVRLALLNNVMLENIVPRFSDDSLLNTARNPIKFQDDTQLKRPFSLESPTFFYRKALNTIAGQSTAEIILKNFFSQESQQEIDYTCGPATVKMIASYFDLMNKRMFCNAPLANPQIWGEIKHTAEMQLAAQVLTSEAEGSEIPDMRNGLLRMGITVFDDDGLSNEAHSEEVLNSHKNVLWSKMQQLMKIGIPIILNMQDRTGGGHFVVAIAIENHASGTQIILAEPGTALSGALEFEVIPQDNFFERWKNMTGEFHGRFMILSPNEQATASIENILQDVFHCKNGEEVNGIINESTVVLLSKS